MMNSKALAAWRAAAETGFDQWAVPEQDRAGLLRWCEYHVLPGDFLAAVLRNDLRDACQRADEDNQRSLWNIVAWLFNHAPAECWGSVDRFEAWANARYAVAGKPMGGE